MSDRQPTQAIRMRSIEDEARTPKYAHYERERRWLIDCAASAALDAVDPIEITDRYVAGTRMRLRQMRQGDDVVWKLTKKYECADPLERPIVTTYLTSEEFELLAGLPAIELTKQRFSVREGSLDFSLDRFGGPLAGLELAEIETSDLAGLRALNGPPWALREVSLDPRYQGATLAANGVPTECAMAKFLIVEARFYDHLNDMLVAGARAALRDAGHEVEVVTVPGALEIPGAIALADQSDDFDGYVAIGAVIRGETYHFEIVAGESARGIMALTMDGVPIGNGILTVENEDQALVRADPAQKDKGGEAAKAALAMLALKEKWA